MIVNATTNNQINHAFWIVAQAKSGVPCAFGNPGRGKTAIASAAAAETLSLSYIQYLLSCVLPEEILGNPVISKITIEGSVYECVKHIPTETMVRARHGRSLVHLDEANHASPQTWAAAQETWLNHPPKNAMVIATCNPEAIATDGFSFSAPVVNRMCILQWEDDHDAWLEGMEKNHFPKPNIPVLPDNWHDYQQKWTAIMAQFARSQPDHFDDARCTPTKDSEMSKPWRSPRSWRNAAISLAACESVSASESTAVKILTGFVGEGPALEFISWYNTLDMPSSEQLFNDPGMLRLPRQFDTAIGIVGGVAAYAKRVINHGDNPGHDFEKGLDFCEAVFRQNREIGVATVSSFVKLKPRNYTMQSRSSQLLDACKAGR